MNLHNLFLNEDVDSANEAYDRPFRGVGGAFHRGDDEHHEIDRAREQRDQSGTWYIRINGKILKTRDGQPYTFRGKAAANKAAVTMQAKPFNAGKEFMLTTNPSDRDINEMDKSAPQPGRDGHVSHSTYGSRDKDNSDHGKEHTATAITPNQAVKSAADILNKAYKNTDKKKDVEEDLSRRGFLKGIGAATIGGAAHADDDAAHHKLADIIAYITIRMNGKTIEKEINLGTEHASPMAAKQAVEKWLADKGIKNYTIRLERASVNEAPKSAAVRLGNAIQRVQGKTAASQARAIIPSSLPKPEPKPQTPVREDEELHIGDPVIVTGPVEFEGSTGEISDFGSGKRFVVVNLYNHGRHSFHTSDISYNDYAGSDEEEARMYDSDPDARAHGVNEQGVAEGNYQHNYGHEFKDFKAELEKKHGQGNVKIVGDGNVADAYHVKTGKHLGFIDGSHAEVNEQGVAEGSQRIDSLVTDALKIMRGSELNDAVQALKTVLGDREYNSRRGHYNFYVRQLIDMYSQQGMAEAGSPAQQAAIAIAKKKDIEEEKVRLDPKCWAGKHKEGTKIKGGVRVNNCVPNESVEEEQVDELNFFKTTPKQEAPKSKTTTADIRKFFQGDKPSNGVGGRVGNTADSAKAKQVYRRYATEGRVKELSADLKSMTDAEFKAQYKMTKAEARANMKPKATAESIQVGDGFIIECGDTAIETVVLGHYNDGILIEFDHTATFMLTDAGVVLTEAEYHGRTVPLGKRMAGDVKKSKVYVKKPNGKVVKVNFGDKNMTIKKHLPKHRKSYRARHHCENPGPRWKANYWSCRAW